MLLPYHFDRLKAATALHGWQDLFTSISWPSFQSTCHRAIQPYDTSAQGGPFKVSQTLAYFSLATTLTPPPAGAFTAPAGTPTHWRYQHNHGDHHSYLW
jgi:hypothetical protein